MTDFITLLSNFASRKFLVAIAAITSATGLVFGGCIADGVYSSVVIASVGAYIAGNVTEQKVAQTTAGK